MTYRIVKPEITNVSRTTWQVAKRSFWFWAILIASISLTLTLVSVGVSTTELANSFKEPWTYIVPIFFPLAYLAWVQHKIATVFWKQVADRNGWTYRDDSDPNGESGIMFQQGHSRSISRYINGVIDGRQFRMFNYAFTIGHGKHSRTYPYTVFAFTFNGSFPHIYLNNRHNSYSISVGEEIPLPPEFEKQFSLSAPRKYEVEALQMFTPDILAGILDNGFKYDIECIGQEVLMFVDGVIHDFETLEKSFNMALQLEDLLDEKLDGFTFDTIGDMPHILK